MSKKTTLNASEIETAVKHWLKAVRNTEVDGEVTFKVGSDSLRATFVAKPQPPMDPEMCMMCGNREADYANGWCVRCSIDWG